MQKTHYRMQLSLLSTAQTFCFSCAFKASTTLLAAYQLWLLANYFRFKQETGLLKGPKNF